MKKHLLSLFLVLFISVPASAELSNLMWASFPVEKYEFLVNEKTSTYFETAPLSAVGNLYISLEKRKIIFKGLASQDRGADPIANNSKFEFLNEEFEIKKIVKIDKLNYAFEAYKFNSFGRMISGKIEIRQINDLSFKVDKFEMSEFGKVYKGTMNRYVQLYSETGNLIVNKFSSIDFGNHYSAMGDDSVKY